MQQNTPYMKGFIPYALAAFLIGIVGGFSSVLGPAFVQEAGIAYNNTTWTALAQAMSTAACGPILGKVGDVIGRKTTLLAGIATFTLGNILSALANSLLAMLAARFIVGIGTAAMSPVIISYIVTQFPRDRTAKGFSLYMLISSASVIFGPTVGGLLISSYGWRTMMWVCVSICAVIFTACLITTSKEDTKRQPLQDFDWLGASLVLVFFSLMLCIPSFGQNFGWLSPSFLVILIAALASMVALINAENKAVHPILPGSFMRRGVFVLCVLALFLTQGLMQANMTNTIVYVNYIQPNNTSISGYAISVMYVGMSLGSVILGPLADRCEPKHVLTGSLLLTGIGCGIPLFFSVTSSSVLIMAFLGVLGFGLGGNGTISMKVALSGLSPKEAGAGTGTYGLFRDLAAPFGVAVFVPYFTNNITNQISAGTAGAAAAVNAIHSLAVAQIVCVAIGILVVLFLPKIHNHKGA